MIVPMEGSAMDMARDIRARRRALGLVQRDLADLSGTSERFVRELERGKPSVRLDKVVAVLDVLGLELRALARDPSQAAMTRRQS